MDAKGVASDELREIVERLAREGLPEPVRFDDAKDELSDKQMTIITSLSDLADQEKAVAQEGRAPIEGDRWWQARLQTRSTLQRAVCAGMVHLGIVQRQAIGYGAIPDPNEGWKYFHLPDSTYGCWKCGAAILAKTQRASVHFAEFTCAGGGEVISRTVPYCPNCEREPSDTTIVRETVAETFARENPELVRMRRQKE